MYNSIIGKVLIANPVEGPRGKSLKILRHERESCLGHVACGHLKWALRQGTTTENKPYLDLRNPLEADTKHHA